MPEQQFNFNTAIKLLFDGSLFGVNRHFITMAIRTGQNASVYAIVPEDLKNLYDVLGKTIKLYEDQYGPIPDSMKPQPSPIDLSKPFKDDDPKL